MLAKEPGDRPASAAEVYETLLPWATVDGEPRRLPYSGRREFADPAAPYRHPFGWWSVSGRSPR